jgi:hypothetical protein
MAPRPPEAGVHGRIVRAYPSSKALQGRDSTGDGACQPRIATVGLTLAPEGTTGLRAIDRHRHGAVLTWALGQELRGRGGTVSRALPHHPGRAARRQGPWLHLDATRARLARARRARRHPLRLAPTLGITCHRRGAAGGAVASELTTARSGLPTPRVPPLQPARLIGGEDARPGLGVPCTLGNGWGLESAHHRQTTDAEVLGHGAIRPPRAGQRPPRCIGGTPPRPARRRPGLGRRRRQTRGDGDGGRAIGLDDGCTAAR